MIFSLPNKVASIPISVEVVVSHVIFLFAIFVIAAPDDIVLSNIYFVSKLTFEENGYGSIAELSAFITFWLPNCPHDALNLRLSIIFLIGSQKASSDIRHPADTEGKIPHLFPSAKREEPS